MSFTKKYLVLMLIGTSVAFTACEKKDQENTEKPETQVVAKVNGDEISIHQVNFQLTRMGQMNEAQSKAAAEKILTRLVEQQLLKQQALEAKIDRDPRVVQAVESSGDEILAQAYLEQLLAKASKPSATEIDTFYNEHPELFANRRIFRLQELVVDVSKDKFSEIESNLKGIKGINEVATWLSTKKYVFTANSNVRTAEQIPSDLLKKLQPLKDGEFILAPSERAINIIHLAASQTSPVMREKAGPIIEQFFLNQSRAELAKKEMSEIKDKAKIEYLGAFSDMGKPEVAKSEVVNPTATVSNNAEPLPASETNAKSQSIIDKSSELKAKPDADQLNMDKGLSGL
ncbi:EpsD family peptidyl-prolyl cis-trans isomerase [Methylotenera sp.]|uniref:EpsD family peptidyl-prolyl cis-trans isomerase n=1 Tax=Methylotenera sp. TaxID=2051956 RepID=UPI0027300F5A|nr:EpsD family peptidyl-prolyl cis-trans isomerase [Methylotenera sp.]MDP2229635.1 EpsD family peptidyl-prolyl cis-trans isomerase [Methylotenera sp.]